MSANEDDRVIRLREPAHTPAPAAAPGFMLGPWWMGILGVLVAAIAVWFGSTVLTSKEVLIKLVEQHQASSNEFRSNLQWLAAQTRDMVAKLDMLEKGLVEQRHRSDNIEQRVKALEKKTGLD